MAHGARIVDFAGWDMPVQYSTIIEEHHAVRKQAGLFDISHMGRLWFDGPEALDLIQRVITNDAASMKVGQVRYSLVCREDGGILDDVLVYRFPQSYMMVVNASNREKIAGWIGQQRGLRNVLVDDVTLKRGMVAIQGPQAVRLTSELAAAKSWAVPDLNAMKYYTTIMLTAGYGAASVILSRTGYTGEDGFEIIVDNEILADVCDRVLALGKRLGIAIVPCGLGARDTLRLEAGMPLYGHELSEKIDPFQAELAWAVKLEKGPFISREALQARRQDARLPHRVGLEVEGKRIAREGAAILAGGNEIGRCCSGTFSPTLEKAIAMAYVQPGFTAVGTQVELDIRGKPAPARVVPLPFYKRNK
jgi:aminomethyltransferase